MKILDKILIGTGVVAVYGITMIFFSEELSSENYPHNNYSQVDSQKPAEVVVYDKEVDEIIQAYYKNIRENPDKLEEENRLINENDRNPEKDSNSEIHEKRKSKKSAIQTVQFHKYVVTDGDSLWRISQKYSVPVYTIISANPDMEKQIIRPGDNLNIPDRPGILYSVKNGDSISALAKRYKMTASKIISINNLRTENLKKGQKIFLPDAKPQDQYRLIFKNRFIWPIYGTITSGYGMRKHPFNNSMQFHTGIDIGANIGQPIHAAADGIVVFSGDGGTYGNMVILRHKDGYISVYAHASSVEVRKGQFIRQGQEIAKVGVTGVTTGPHLHFEVKKFNNGINPLQALHDKVKIKVSVNS